MAPRPEEMWLYFSALWSQGQFEAMYSLLTPEAQQRTSREQFAAYHRDLQQVTSLRSLTTEITSSLVSGETAQIGYRRLFVTDLFGTIEDGQTVVLALHQGDWLVDWYPWHVLSVLSHGGSLALQEVDVPRGAILDRSGQALAILGARVVVGVVPGEIKHEAQLLSTLSRLLGEDEQEIRSRYVAAARPDWFMPVGELTPEEAQEHYAELTGLEGVLLRERAVRWYPEGEVAAHITGYVGVITGGQLAYMQAEGYKQDDIVGQSGLEQQFQRELAGRRGARLLALGPGGEVRAPAAEREAKPSQSLYTTVDLPLQRLADSLLEGKRGAIVALEPGTGQVLCLATGPSFDPNAVVAGLSGEQWRQLLEDGGRPLLNRPTQSELPLGSVFKIVTYTAALASGIYEPDSSFYCPGSWSGLGSSYTVRCWLRSGHGSLTLAQGLTASCNVVFAEVGKNLHQSDPGALPDAARAYGFGALTGLEVLDESPGLVPDAAWKQKALGEAWYPGDTVNLAIGQGHLLVTPLQVARMIAAVANGGRLPRPNLVLGLGSPQPQGEASEDRIEAVALPLSEEATQNLRASLRDGCMTPLGTAYQTLGDMSIAVAGKTGSAENPGQESHAWFAGYAPAEDPKIAVAVVVENGGQGSLVAAPLFRRLIEAYLASAA